jgi:hypothetical protein
MSRLDDAELIAKLLEGRATPQEREAILQRADADPDLLAALADSAALHESDAASPAWRRALPSRANAPLWLMAAMLMFAVGFPIAMRGRGPIPPLSGEMLDARAMVDGAVSGAPRQTLRGEATSARIQRSAELGARVTDWETLVRTGHPEATSLALELAAAARAIPGGSVAASRFDGLGPTADLLARRTAVAALASIMDGARFRAGEWAEAARLAGAAQSETFLRSTGLRDAIARIAASRALPADARAAASRITTALLSSPVDPAAVERAATELLVALSR